MNAVLAVLLNAFWVAFVADTAISIVDELLLVVTGLHLLAWLRGPVAGVVLLASLPLYGTMALTPRIPRRLVAPLALFAPGYVLLGMPLAYWRGWSDHGNLQFCLAQLALVVLAGLLLHRRCGRPWFTESGLRGPLFSWRSSLGFSAATLLLVAPALGLCFLLLCERCMDRFTAGYVRLGPAGLDLKQNVFERDGQRVHLLGMIHIGEPDAYVDMLRRLPMEDATVLAEGVSDRELLLDSGLCYQELAEKVGLDAQQSFERYAWGLHIQQADVDVSDFSPDTVRMLNLVSQIQCAEVFDLHWLLAYLEASAEMDPAQTERFWHEVINMRNEHVAGRMRQELGTYRQVVIPWGAAHMPGLEVQVLAEGFELEETHHHRLIDFGRLLGFVASQVVSND